MLSAALAVLAALAFVLGLGALCLWALKRWGTMSLASKQRIAMEVVHRIALGPKTGLAVVRVGEKVMAVSVGDGGIRTLFELDEGDRQRIIESSLVPTPMMSSRAASAAFARFLPGAFGETMSAAMFNADTAHGIPTPFPNAAPVTVPPVVTAPTGIVPRMRVTSTAPEIPSFLLPHAHSRTSIPNERELRTMFGGALSGATRLLALAGLVLVGSARLSQLSAQTIPPTAPGLAAPKPALPTPEARLPRAATTPTSGTAQPTPPVAPAAPLVPPSMRSGRGAAARTATPAATAAPIQGNGAATTAGGTATRRPMSRMQVDSADKNEAIAQASRAQPAAVGADEAIMRMLPQMDVQLGDAKDGGLRLNGTVGIVVMMGLLTLLPTLLLMMTGFTRILIVLHFLKQALGTQSAPPAQLLAAMALLLTGFVMAPTLSEVNNKAITPWLDGTITQVEMMKTGVVPMREFMLKQTRESDLKTFVEMSRLPRPNSAADVPLHVLMSAFVASELRTAFQIGFAIYLPFIIIDTVVASVLMSMGMFMLPPAMISLPFKLLLFVLVDGWSLTISSLVQSFK